MKKTIVNLSWDHIASRADKVAYAIGRLPSTTADDFINLFGVPRGGIYAVQAVARALSQKNIANRIVSDYKEAHILIDDIIDSGSTRKDYFKRVYPKIAPPFLALVDYQGVDSSQKGTWMSFPWERMINDDGPVQNIRRLIEYIGDDPDREGLKETPDRVLKSYKTLFGGYNQDPKEFCKIFTDDSCDEMVIVRDIEFFSTCEHHMLPFFGKAHIAYIPNGQVIGVSKLVRILEVFSRRLQIQERLCQQITEALNDMLKPVGVACVLEAQHFCMAARGVQKQNSKMITSSLVGAFKEEAKVRSEFMGMIGK